MRIQLWHVHWRPQLVFMKDFQVYRFTIVAAFAAVVMFDAQSVRKAAGEQAKILNQILDELLQEHHLSEKNLKNFWGIPV